MPRALLLWVLLSLVGVAQAAPTELCIGNWCLPKPAFDLLYQQAQARQPGLTASAYQQQVVDTRLLAQYARSQHFQVTGDPYGVGFSPATRLEQERYGLFHGQLGSRFVDYAKIHLGKNGLNAFLKAPIHDSGADMDAALKPENPRAIALTSQQLTAAQQLVLVRYQFPGTSAASFTLADLYQRQNVQGRLALQQPDRANYVHQQVRDYLLQQYFFWWLSRESGLSADAIQRADDALADHALNDAWLKQQGLVEIMDEGDSPVFAAAMKKVTQAQVVAWYAQHKADFRVVNSVHALHVACASEATCTEARKALLKGTDVDEVVKRYADKTHQGQTDLGELTRQRDGMQWLASLALMQKPGSYSKAVRAPDGHWEVVWVTRKASGYLPVDSSSVRYQASRAIARATLLQEYDALMKRLRKQTKVSGL